LLERSTHLNEVLGGGSLTALPIIETEAQDISAYIPTNLISITDGQIYLSPSLFAFGILPAVNVGKSVSRVGGKAQRGAYRAVAGDLKLSYAQFEELEAFSRFGARVDPATQKIITHGQRIRASLRQAQNSPLTVAEQIIELLAIKSGLFDPIPLHQMPAATLLVQQAAASLTSALRDRLVSAEHLSDADHNALLNAARQALAEFSGDKKKPNKTGKKQLLSSES
jgi:F-type H+/Na+-transporting ATPase subunit alpha